MSGWANKPTFSAFVYPTAAQMEALADQVDALTGTGWVSYTPTWTASVSNPAIGNGTLTARYRQATESDLVTYEGRMLAGTTTTFGSGFWIMSVPVTASASSGSIGVGPGYALDASSQSRTANCRLLSTTTLVFDTNSGSITSASPAAWALSDELRWSITYEAA